MENGWIKLHRKVIEKGYYRNSKYVHLWVHLLLLANHKSKEFMWNNQIILIKEGQLITGRDSLAFATGISQSSIERILNMLESEHQIEQQKTTKYRLITIVNWKQHQTMDSKVDNKRTTDGQQMDTNKNVKKDKNEKNSEPSSQDIVCLLDLFSVINPAVKRMYGNTTQRKACQSLIYSYGLERVKKIIIETLPKTNNIQFFPTITTPLQLQDKFTTLESAIRKYQSEKLSTKRGIADINKKNDIQNYIG